MGASTANWGDSIIFQSQQGWLGLVKTTALWNVVIVANSKVKRNKLQRQRWIHNASH